MAPKVRARRHGERIWFGLLKEPSDEQIKILCSDHQIGRA
jgi:hypothetical protein